MIARPKISRDEWKTTEIGGSEVGNFALLSCPGYALEDVPEVLRVGQLYRGCLRAPALDPVAVDADGARRAMSETALEPGQQKRAKFPTSKAHISAVFHPLRLIFGRAIISRNGLEA